MKPIYHLAVSTVISGILYTIFRSWGLVIASFISGIFLDLDHIIDYFIINGIHFNLKEFSNFFKKKKYWKVASKYWRINLIFHGWEWLVILSILAGITNWNPVVTGILIGAGHHIILDVFNNKPNSWQQTFFSYSLLWRWKNSSRP
jgi:hypothetical protein